MAKKLLNIAVEGCCHGELDRIYQTIRDSENINGIHVDLLLICGDFECLRDNEDLHCLAVPEKYKKLNTFHQYLSGEKVAHVPTIFIGGNHEASNVLQSYYYGGWVAPNIYFLGFAGVVWFGGVRISGTSGIFNSKHFYRGHFEIPPYNSDTLRSVYHQRELEMWRLSMVSKRPDIFLSHDWPTGIWDYGDRDQLLKTKPFFRDDIKTNSLGSPPLMDLLKLIQPRFWFSAHLHVKFPAVVVHSTAEDPSEAHTTCFLALDKVLPGRDFLQVIPVECQREDMEMALHFDLEWLAILKRTHRNLSTSPGRVDLPSHMEPAISESELAEVRDRITHAFGNLKIPHLVPLPRQYDSPRQEGNIFTDRLLEALGLEHIWTVATQRLRSDCEAPSDANAISIDDL